MVEKRNWLPKMIRSKFRVRGVCYDMSRCMWRKFLCKLIWLCNFRIVKLCLTWDYALSHGVRSSVSSLFKNVTDIVTGGSADTVRWNWKIHLTFLKSYDWKLFQMNSPQHSGILRTTIFRSRNGSGFRLYGMCGPTVVKCELLFVPCWMNARSNATFWFGWTIRI